MRNGDERVEGSQMNSGRRWARTTTIDNRQTTNDKRQTTTTNNKQQTKQNLRLCSGHPPALQVQPRFLLAYLIGMLFRGVSTSLSLKNPSSELAQPYGLALSWPRALAKRWSRALESISVAVSPEDLDGFRALMQCVRGDSL